MVFRLAGPANGKANGAGIKKAGLLVYAPGRVPGPLKTLIKTELAGLAAIATQKPPHRP